MYTVCVFILEKQELRVRSVREVDRLAVQCVRDLDTSDALTHTLRSLYALREGPLLGGMCMVSALYLVQQCVYVSVLSTICCCVVQ